MTSQNTFDNQIFLISINAPAPLSVYLWSRFFEELKHKNIISLDDEAEHSDYIAQQPFSVYFEEYTNLFQIQTAWKFEKGDAVHTAKKLIPEPFYSIIESTYGAVIP